MIITPSVLNPDTAFTLNGVDYERGIYTVHYGNLICDTNGNLITSAINVGLRSRFEFQKLLVYPIPVTAWSNGTGNFTDFATLVDYLVDVVGSPASGIEITQQVTQFNDLVAGTVVGQLAYVEESQGTPWLPGTLLGTYYPAGFYLWDGVDWVSDRNAIANQFEQIIVQLATVVSDVHFEFDQAVPSSSWVIAHNLSKFPAVTIVDSGGTEIEGDIDHTDNDNLTITFSSAFSGKAYLN